VAVDGKDPARTSRRGRSIVWIADGSSVLVRNQIRGSVGVFADEPEAQPYFTGNVRVVTAQQFEKAHRCAGGAGEGPVTPGERIAVKVDRPSVKD
jgi:hypothetical protein